MNPRNSAVHAGMNSTMREERQNFMKKKVWVSRNITSEVCGQFSIAESSSWPVSNKISTIWWEVCLDRCIEIVVVPNINNRVPKDDECRNKRVSINH